MSGTEKVVADPPTQVLMGVVAGIIQVARTMNPPSHLSGKQALEAYAEVVDDFMACEFPTEWPAFLAHVRGEETP